MMARKSARINVRLPPDLREFVDACAERLGCSRGRVVRLLIMNAAARANRFDFVATPMDEEGQ